MKQHSLMVWLIAGTLLLAGCSRGKQDAAPKEESWDKKKQESVAKKAADDASIGVDKNSADESAWQSGEKTDKLIYNLDQLRTKPATKETTTEEFVLEELNYEVKRIAAELKHTQKKLTELQTKSEIWTNPLSIYSKEVHLENGTKIFGDIIDQDKNTVQVKTLIGVLTLERSQILRIVDNIPAQPEDGGTAAAGPDGNVPMNMPAGQGAQGAAPNLSATLDKTDKYSANVVLNGNVKESKDRSGNTILSGVVKNIGGHRADFVKVNFLFRINWSGDTRELTAFVKGSHHVFASGISTDTSLFPGASGSFELYVPKSFGTFIGYSYSIEWEEHDL